MASVSLATTKIQRIPRGTTVAIPGIAMSATVPVSSRNRGTDSEIRLFSFSADS